MPARCYNRPEYKRGHHLWHKPVYYPEIHVVICTECRWATWGGEGVRNLHNAINHPIGES